MGPDDKFENPIELGLKDNIEPARFTTPNELHEWLSGQFAFYNNLIGKHAATDQALQNAWTSITKLIQDGPNRLNTIKSNANATQKDYENAIRRTVAHYSQKRLLDAHSPTGEFLNTLSQSEPVLAAHVATILLRAPVALGSAQSPLWLEAGAFAVAWQRGWLDKAPSEDASLNVLKDAWTKRLAELESSLQATKSSMDDHDKLIADRAIEAAKKLKEFDDKALALQTEWRTKSDRSITDGQAQIDDFKNAYNKALALRAPNHYWRNKQRGHRIAAGLWFVAFVLAAVGTVAGVWFVWHLTIELKFTNEPPPYTAFIPSIGVALLGAWFMRLCSRQAISNLSLSADAGERVSMVQTYLALREGGHASDEHLSLILSSLFRSASKPSDDGGPPTIADSVGKILRGEK